MNEDDVIDIQVTSGDTQVLACPYAGEEHYRWTRDDVPLPGAKEVWGVVHLSNLTESSLYSCQTGYKQLLATRTFNITVLRKYLELSFCEIEIKREMEGGKQRDREREKGKEAERERERERERGGGGGNERKNQVFVASKFFLVTLYSFWKSHSVLEIIFLTLCEETARSTKLRNMPFCKCVFYQKKKKHFCLLQPSFA